MSRHRHYLIFNPTMSLNLSLFLILSLLFISAISAETFNGDDSLIRQVVEGQDESSPNLLTAEQHHFSLFKRKFKKSYLSQEEHDYRFSVFKSNLRRAARHQKLDPTASHGVTQFSDLTSAEFRKQVLGLRKLRLPKDANKAPILPTNDLPEDFDWREKGAVGPVKNQGSCGSCWSFSTTGALEGAHFLATGELVSLSEQQLVDCDHECDPEEPGSCDSGCNGGLMNSAFEYTLKAGGLMREEDYPYTGMDRGACKFEKIPLISSSSSEIRRHPAAQSHFPSYSLQSPLMERLLLIVFATIISLFISTFAAGEFNFEANPHRRSLDETLCNQLIKPAGYSCTEHTVQTKDGYLVALQRLSSRNKDPGGQRGPPVLLQHGLFMAGDAWFLGSPEQSLGFILADEGFDVWVGNVRGTFWSHGHVSLSEKDKEFWDWSWEELALCDLAEMIHHVHSITSSKVFIVGHSQGTIMSLAALIQPNVAEMVEAAALLCPISYLDHLTAPLVLRMVALHLDQMVLAMGIHQLNFRSKILIDLLDSICDGHIECADLLTSITGKNCCFNSSSVDFFFEFEPHPSSAKNLRHLFQMIRKGTFSRYDYGMFKNLELYGQLNPPAFDLGLIPKTLPLWMGYGGHDSLADETDLERTLKELQGKPELLYLENYGHLDFLLSTQGKEDVYNNMIAFFRSLGKSSSS